MADYKYILRILKRKASLSRFFNLFNGMVLLATLCLILLSLGVVLALVFPLGGSFFLGYSLLSWSLFILAGVVILYTFLRPFDRERCALWLERRFPHLGSELISVVQLGDRRHFLTGSLGISGEMIDALAAGVRRKLTELKSRPVVERRILYRNISILAVIVFAVLAGRKINPVEYGEVLAAMLNPLEARSSSRIVLNLSPGDVRILEGDTLTVKAEMRGDPKNGLQLELMYPGRTGKPDRVQMDRRASGTFVKEFFDVAESFVYRAHHPKVSTPWYTVSVSAVPRAGDLQLVLNSPAYTGLPPLRQDGSGHIQCLKGTVVDWSARVNKPLAEAYLKMASGAMIHLDLNSDGTVEGEFVVRAGGRYQVSLLDTEGFTGRRPDEYDINLIIDEFPSVELLSPSDDLELGGTDLVDIFFTATDDYGLAESTLVYQLEDGSGGRVKVPGADGRKTYQSGYSWDLGELDLQPGQRVNYHLEVLDNDSISGPKTGVSPGRSIWIKDARAEHRDLAQMEKELVEELTDVLGDELELWDAMLDMEKTEEEPEELFEQLLTQLASQQSAAARKFEQAMEKMDAYLTRMSEDALSDPSALYMKVLARQMLKSALGGEQDEEGQLKELTNMEDMARDDQEAELGWMAEKKEKRISLMEQALQNLQESSRYQNMEEALRQQEGLLDRQRDLADMLNQLEGEPSGQETEELIKTIRDIARMIGDLMQQLAGMQAEMPEEFLNSDALSDLPFEDILENLKELAEALMKGDMEKARQMADQLVKQMSQLLDSLRAAAQEFNDITEQGIDNFQDQEMNEIAKLIESQKRILQQTEQMKNNADQRFAEQLKKKKAAEATEATEEANGLKQEQALKNEEEPALSPEERSDFDRLAGEQVTLQKKTEDIAGKIYELAKLLPMIPRELGESLQEASVFMEEAGGELSAYSPHTAIPPQREALFRLMKAQSEGLQAGGEMARLSRLRGNRQGAMGEASRLFGIMPQLSVMPGMDMRDGGRAGLSIRSFKIPGSQEFEVPKVLREEIMKSMKAGYPPAFEKAIRQYYRNITE